MGELSLDGSIQPIKGALPIAIKAREDGFEGLIIPQQIFSRFPALSHLQNQTRKYFDGHRTLLGY